MFEIACCLYARSRLYQLPLWLALYGFGKLSH